MPQSKELASFGDCLALMDMALSRPKGIVVKCRGEKEARSLRFRLYTARRREQEKYDGVEVNGEKYVSPYMQLQFTIRGEALALCVAEKNLNKFKILDPETEEEISSETNQDEANIQDLSNEIFFADDGNQE